MGEKLSPTQELEELRMQRRIMDKQKREAEYDSPKWWNAMEKSETLSLKITQIERRMEYEGKLELNPELLADR